MNSKQDEIVTVSQLREFLEGLPGKLPVFVDVLKTDKNKTMCAIVSGYCQFDDVLCLLWNNEM